MDAIPTAPLAEQLHITALVVWAMALGGVVGFERQRFSKPAGLRTHMLVAGAACLITAVTAELALLGPTGDPTRGIHAVVTGIGFLGGAAVVRQQDLNPSGLTTAATVLYTAIIGCAVAIGYGITATAATILALLTLQLLGRGRRNGDSA
jgi:putative Mg2+ transporter-C (MgtC) family protein